MEIRRDLYLNRSSQHVLPISSIVWIYSSIGSDDVKSNHASLQIRTKIYFDTMYTIYYISIRKKNDMALTSTVTFRTTPELKERVDNLAKRTRRSSGFYYNVLLEDYLSEIEDIYDAIDISEKVKAGKEKTYSSDEIRKELGL